MTDPQPAVLDGRRGAHEAPFDAATAHAHYRLAYADPDFMMRDELRGVRLQLELLKPELVLKEFGVQSTLVIYGSARIPTPELAQQRLEAAQTETERRRAEKQQSLSKYYDIARQLARLASSFPQKDTAREFVVCSGGGPSIMEAANRGAHDVGAPSVALNVVLPHEQRPNAFVTPELAFQFHYFPLRKLHFIMRARAICAFPGGFGTFDELFEALTVIQTGKSKPIPVLLFGETYWRDIINFEAMADYGVIGDKDLALWRFVETAEEAWDYILSYWGEFEAGE